MRLSREGININKEKNRGITTIFVPPLSFHLGLLRTNITSNSFNL